MDVTKSCFKCHATKPLSEFYRHSETADGHLGKCKDCTKRDVKARRLAKVDAVRHYDRSRARLPHRRAQAAIQRMRQRALHPGRDAVRLRVRRAVQAGRIVKPAVCQWCGCTPRRIEAHHDNYGRPLDVTWLCKPCHAIADQNRRAKEAAQSWATSHP